MKIGHYRDNSNEVYGGRFAFPRGLQEPSKLLFSLPSTSLHYVGAELID